MSKLTPDGPAGLVRLTVKANVVVAELPSFALASLMLRSFSVAMGGGVSEKSSTARPSSAPGAMSESVQRIQNPAPFAIDRPVMLNETFEKLPALLPTMAPPVAARFGLLKSRPL